MNVEEQFKPDFETLFTKAQKDNVPFSKRGYAMPKEITQNATLFIGLNPSYIEHRVHDAHSSSHFYDQSKATVPYFRKFAEMGTDAHPWSHMDLLAIRETKQNKVQELERTHTRFVWESVVLSKKILEETQPKVIVVANALARKYLGKDRFVAEDNTEHNVWMGYDFGKIQDDGTFRIQNPDSKLKGVPVFFSGMLTGQRALDLGSFERLKWHVHKVLAASS